MNRNTHENVSRSTLFQSVTFSTGTVRLLLNIEYIRVYRSVKYISLCIIKVQLLGTKMSNNPNLPYARYPVHPELRCGSCRTSGKRNHNRSGDIAPIAGVAYKNGKPYDCKCDLISAPYSMPYEANGCKQCQPPFHAVCNPNRAKCSCHHKATLYNNNMYEAFNFPGKWY